MNRYSHAVQKAEQHKSFINLSNSNFSECGWQAPIAEIRSGFELYLSDPHYVPDPAGDIAAREAISSYYADRGMDMPAGQFILTAGTSDAFRLTLLATTEPGDEILLPLPSYPLFEDIISLHNRIPKFYELVSETDVNGTWTLNIDSIRAAAGSKSRLLVIVSPNNPSGWVASSKELQSLVPVCEENNISVIWDEVFAEYIRDTSEDSASPEILKAAGITYFLLGGLSKPFLAPELKLGWIYVSRTDEIFQKMILIHDLFLPVSSPVQRCVPKLFAMNKFPSMEVKEHTRTCLDSIRTLLPNDFQLLRPSGGIHAVLKCKNQHPDDETRALFWLHDHQVAIQPGYLYGMDEHSQGSLPHWIISLIVPLEIQVEAWNRLFFIKTKAEYECTEQK